MVKISLLFISVLTLFCFMMPSFILRKIKLADAGFAKVMSVFTLYVAQGAMVLHGFIMPYDSAVMKGVVQAFLLALLSHIVFYLVAKQCFKKAPDRMKRVLQFGLIFSNAGYMGIPVISDVFGPDYVIYATAYLVWFNVFAYSLGRLIYTNDKKYISMKKAIVNPAVIPICIGLVIYLTGLGGMMQEAMITGGFAGQAAGLVYNILTVLKNMVAPTSMMVIGARLADVDFKGAHKDKYLYPFILIRLFALPAIMWVIMRILLGFGVIEANIMAVILILNSTPAAAITTMFAELYDGDSPYAGKLVAITTILSVATMPLVALLLKF